MQHIILLRGINVGGRNIKMAELKTCFEKAGYEKTSTVLQTGNVIVDSKEKSPEKLRKHVEKLLSDTFHYPAKVLVVAPSQLKLIMEQYPFPTESDFHRYVVFTEKGFEKELVKEAGELDEKIEKVKEGKNVVYWNVLKGHTLDSTFGKYLSKAAAKNCLTTRNMNTLEKIMNS